MTRKPTTWGMIAAPLVVIVLLGASWRVAQLPEISGKPRAELASHYRFERSEIADMPALAHQTVRKVAPSLERISAWISGVGASVALGDLDGDGLANDLVIIDPRVDVPVLRPAPGTPQRFEAFVLDAAPLSYDNTMAPTGAVCGDFNEDGLSDVLVFYWGRTPIAFLQKPGGAAGGLTRAAFVASEIVDETERWYTDAVTQADLDGDGHYDLVIGNYFPDGSRILDPNATERQSMHNTKSRSFTGGRDRLLLWKSASSGEAPSVRYTDVPGVLTDEVARGWTLAIGAGDLDGDLLPELYLAHDFGPDRLLHNESTPGHLKFSVCEGSRSPRTPKSCCLGHDSFKGMGCDFADINNDGLFDIYVSNIATEFGLEESHFLWENTGEKDAMQHGRAPFVQASEKYGLSRSGWGWESKLADFNNDGVLEAVQATGFIKGRINRWPELQALGTANDQIISNPTLWPSFRPGTDISGRERDAFFARGADGVYHNIAEDLGIDPELAVTRGIATADVDGDGKLDFAVANQWEPSFFYHNVSAATGRFLGLHLLLPPRGAEPPAVERSDSQEFVRTMRPGHPGADTPGRPATGACVRIRLPDGSQRISLVDGGNGFAGRRSPDVHFGLGDVPESARINVEVCYRDAIGMPQKAIFDLPPGWHTVVLENGRPKAGGEQ